MHALKQTRVVVYDNSCYDLKNDAMYLLKCTSSDHNIWHLSLENSCTQVLWPMLKYFYTKRSAISLAFKRYQYFPHNQSAFTSSFHFSDATATWIWAEFTKSGQSWYFALVTLCKKFRQTADWHPFLWSEFLICHIFKWSEEVWFF